MRVVRKPAELFHYTSNAGFLGITRSGEIWASHIAYQNDAADYVYPLLLMGSELDAAAQAVTKNDEHDLLELAHNLLRSRKHMLMFVVSFSAERDLLSQWRAYCPPGEGVSIGFKPGRLMRVAKKQHFRLESCIYERHVQKRIVQSLIRAHLKAYRNARHSTRSRSRWDSKVGDAADQLAIQLHDLAPRFKDQSFREEREWRLISPPSIDNAYPLHYRAVRSLIVPYTPFRLEDEQPEQFRSRQLTYSTVVVGPNPHQTLALNSVKTVLSTAHVFAQQVIQSTTSYRGW